MSFSVLSVIRKAALELSRGDSGIDMLGNHNHYLLLFQCKDLTNKVKVDYI
ncbi:16861_t:CDS:2 [Dentiscutata erythropus]|uniref:16861_t:CDS:1 n=1 Tax=Dentiscutata erythropus TaxID=1348616 RepID=A0A9N9CJ87_9GLOM|nr:16861_t:CDS:2 [Dentiscutata erythropus]